MRICCFLPALTREPGTEFGDVEQGDITDSNPRSFNMELQQEIHTHFLSQAGVVIKILSDSLKKAHTGALRPSCNKPLGWNLSSSVYGVSQKQSYGSWNQTFRFQHFVKHFECPVREEMSCRNETIARNISAKTSR
ncbi:hypothetical protein J6590_088204 [Homalodisca vitripennis]|nr:hypothetical protein J6590_088204 [Homalodisca vitripennis]